MSDWKEFRPCPDGPGGQVEVINAWTKQSPNGLLYLTKLKKGTEYYATLGVVGRLPDEKEIDEAAHFVELSPYCSSVPEGAISVHIYAKKA